MGDVSPEVFKRAVGSFATGVTVVTAVDRRGQRYGFTANSFASVSLDPPLVLLCLARRAPSAWAFEPGRPFNVNILAAHQQELSGHFASPKADKFASVAHREGANGLPVLDDCHAHLECRLEHWYHGGDHLILVGWVERAEVNDDTQPLLFHRSRYISATPAVP
jgi:flavin reductase (DIM6/NTAB) family NADH-FMN oxidoreductase RutF